MQFTQGFLRKSISGKWVGVLKYKDPLGTWRQVTKTFTRDREESELMLAEWRTHMAGDAPIGASGGIQAASAGGMAGGAMDGVADGSAFGATGSATGSAAVGGPAGGPGIPTGRTAIALTPGASGPQHSPTVEQAVRACLDAQLARGRIERSTHDMQLRYAERSIFPELGPTPLSSLTARDVQAWIDRLCLDMAPGSARIPYAVLSKTCAKALREGVITSNPLANTDPPARTQPTRAYLPPSSRTLLERAIDTRWGRSHPYTCAVRLALYSGLRIGEACGLRWRDIGTGTRSLRVVSSIGRSAEGCYVKSPKNATSAREFPIVTALSKQLDARRKASREHGSDAFDESWFVCCDGGEFANPQLISIAFAELCDREGIVDSTGRRATFHMLRHTFATEAVQRGVDVRTLADLLGHAGADITLNVYAASGDDAKRAAAARLEGAFG